VARYILAADWIIIDEISLLTPWVVNRVSMTLGSISGYDRIEFGGSHILLSVISCNYRRSCQIDQCQSIIDSQHTSVIDIQIQNFNIKYQWELCICCELSFTLNCKGLDIRHSELEGPQERLWCHCH
jgi:hypothetical protein